MKILDVRIDNVSRDKAHEMVVAFLEGNDQNTIFTPNPEMLVDAQSDQMFKSILNSGSLNLCDGSGIQMVSKERIERITGSEFILDVCAIAEKIGRKVYFLGSGDGELIAEATKNVKRIFPKLSIIGNHPGTYIILKRKNGKIIFDPINSQPEVHKRLIEDIKRKKPDILFVGFGHNKQERWINMFLKDLPSVRIAMGVGGSFDFLAGKLQRAPRWMRKLGLEWLWRLGQEPWRVRRIWKATVVFLWLVFKLRKKSNSKL